MIKNKFKITSLLILFLANNIALKCNQNNNFKSNLNKKNIHLHVSSNLSNNTAINKERNSWTTYAVILGCCILVSICEIIKTLEIADVQNTVHEIRTMLKNVEFNIKFCKCK
ncbi:hypothetical protein GF322_03910 [Candidatus Dependentiae bacterium]|nr:hypothetical protein [Candidatus Dependentiae bacterium]